MQPKPCGHHILIKPRRLEDVDKNYASAKRSGIILTQATQRQEQIAVSVGQVLALGPVAYQDTPNGKPWCKVGDWVAYARHGGMYIEEPSEENSGYLILNDIDVVAIVEVDAV
jgi:co-chaperonin GroES (HSP10)